MRGSASARILGIISLALAGCTAPIMLSLPREGTMMTGSGFYKLSAAFQWRQRDSLALQELSKGNIPDFLRKLVSITVEIDDTSTGKKIRATYYVTPDYLAIGNNEDWARINITPMAGQKFANLVNCFLPTRKMVDDIYKAAAVKLEPVPMYAYRDSTPTMWQHHLIIEGQRQGRSGLIAGIKKDVVISGKISRDQRPDRVAIYGWHKPDGKPIQPLYTGHINWWVDYSQGIRLVWRKIKIGKEWMDYTEVLKHPLYRQLICDEEFCDFYTY